MNDTKEPTDVRDVLDAVAAMAPATPVARGSTVMAPSVQPAVTVTLVEFADADGGVNVAHLFGALAKAQGEFTAIQRTMTARIKSRREGGADYSYDYAPLDEVLAVVIPVLSKNGLVLMQFPKTQAHTVLVRTIIAHESGQRLWNDLQVGCTSTDPKDVGGAITYARRYAAMSILGLAPDTDTDAGNPAQVQSKSQVKRLDAQGAPDPERRRDGETKSMITACRPVQRAGKTFYAIKSTTGECFTKDTTLYNVAQAAMRSEKPVVLVTEQQPSNQPGRTFTALVEIR